MVTNPEIDMGLVDSSHTFGQTPTVRTARRRSPAYFSMAFSPSPRYCASTPKPAERGFLP